jgi:ABC-type dipeptide/oligopeptide/nickel transport system permease subunit
MSMRARSTIWLIVLVALIAFSSAAPLLTTVDPLHAESGQSLRSPSALHPLGTDLIGRDVYSRLLYGGRQTLGSAALATLIAVVPGMLIGLIAGYYGGLVDSLIGMVTDALLALPGLLIALTVIALTGSGAVQSALAVGLAGIPAFIRVTRATTRVVRHRSYIEAARSLGARTIAVMVRHLLPNIMPTIAAYIAVTFSWALLNGAALAFLGFTADPSTPDWGVMLAAGRQVLPVAPLAAFAPGLALTLTVWVVNRLAESLANLE